MYFRKHYKLTTIAHIFPQMSEFNNDIKNEVRKKHNFRRQSIAYIRVSLVNEAMFMSLIVSFSMCCPEVYKLDRKLKNKIKLCGVIVKCWESIRGDSSCWLSQSEVE